MLCLQSCDPGVRTVLPYAAGAKAAGTYALRFIDSWPCLRFSSQIGMAPRFLFPGISLRADARHACRAVGDYATQAGQGEEGPKAVAAFFKALEGYDYLLLSVSGPAGQWVDFCQRQVACPCPFSAQLPFSQLPIAPLERLQCGFFQGLPVRAEPPAAPPPACDSAAGAPSSLPQLRMPPALPLTLPLPLACRMVQGSRSEAGVDAEEGKKKLNEAVEALDK